MIRWTVIPVMHLNTVHGILLPWFREEPGRRMLKHERLTHLIIGAFFDVYSELGAGFIESVYRNALAVRLTQLDLIVGAEVPLEVYFRGVAVGYFRADLVVNRLVLLELKAVSALCHEHEKQLINYLTASHLEVGLLLNFGPRPQLRRFISSSGRVVRAAENRSGPRMTRTSRIAPCKEPIPLPSLYKLGLEESWLHRSNP